MKKNIPFILLISILFLSNGFILYFKYLQNNIRQEIKCEIRKGIDEDELTVIEISSENEQKIEWIIKGKEFRFNGAMYDVVKVEIQNHRKLYYCVNDTKEKHLVDNFVRNNRRQNKILLNLRKIINGKYFPEKYVISSKITKSDIYFLDYKNLYVSVFIETLSPPPKFNFYV